MNPLLTKTYDSGAAVSAHRIVKFGDADYQIVHAVADDDALIGISDLGADAEGDRVDVHRTGLAKVEYGDTVARGQPLTSDGQGRAVPATAGDNHRYVGFAEVSGAVGDIGLALIAPGFIPATA